MHSTMNRFDPTELEKYEQIKRSFLSEDIKEWCMENYNNDNFDYKYLARGLYDKYYKAKSDRAPHPKQYYYITLDRDFKPTLRRDLIISPILKSNQSKVTTAEIRHLVHTVNKYKRFINSSRREDDKTACLKILTLLDIRLNKAIKTQKFRVDKIYTYSPYMKLQVYTIYEDAAINLFNYIDQRVVQMSL